MAIQNSFQPRAPLKFPAAKAAPKKGAQNTLALPPPPQGTYDPSLDYNAYLGNQGLLQATNDAETQFNQGTQDYQTGLANLLSQHNNNLADIGKNYMILGHQQADSAAAHGITSQGLLALSAAKRDANQATDTGRENANYTNAKTAADATYAREYGGFEGHQVLDPYTGQPVFGQLATSIARAGDQNTHYQSALQGQMAQQAQANGYVYSPPTVPTASATATFARRQQRQQRGPSKGVLR